MTNDDVQDAFDKIYKAFYDNSLDPSVKTSLLGTLLAAEILRCDPIEASYLWGSFCGSYAQTLKDITNLPAVNLRVFGRKGQQEGPLPNLLTD
jgi:hypothetical protein